MLNIGDYVRSRGSQDRFGQQVSCTVWTIFALGKIEGSAMNSVVAFGEHFGQPVWLTGLLDPKGKPGHPPEKILLAESEVSRLEESALDYHRERMSGDFL